MRTLLISATLLALAGATPALAQSYRDAISPHDRSQDRRYDASQAQSSQDGQDAYRDRGAQDSYLPAPRRKARRATAAVSRYTPAGQPVYYNDGMIRTGRDFPPGTVGLNGY